MTNLTQSTTDKASRQRRAYVAVLAVALGGLVVDRLVLTESATGPEPAQARDASPQVAATSGQRTAPAAAAQAAKGPRLATRLDEMAQVYHFELTNIEDAFKPAATWIPSVVAATEVTLTPAQQFAAKHKLVALINNSGGGAAIIGNQTVTVGKEVDGFRLVQVTKNSAILEKDGQRVELSLPKPNFIPTALAD